MNNPELKIFFEGLDSAWTDAFNALNFAPDSEIAIFLAVLFDALRQFRPDTRQSFPITQGHPIRMQADTQGHTLSGRHKTPFYFHPLPLIPAQLQGLSVDQGRLRTGLHMATRGQIGRRHSNDVIQIGTVKNLMNSRKGKAGPQGHRQGSRLGDKKNRGLFHLGKSRPVPVPSVESQRAYHQKQCSGGTAHDVYCSSLSFSNLYWNASTNAR